MPRRHTQRTLSGTDQEPSDVSEHIRQLRAFAREMADRHQVSSDARSRPLVTRFLSKQQALLRDIRAHFAEMGEVRLSLSIAGEWLLDNYYAIQQSFRQIREDMPARFYGELPLLGSGPLRGFPRLYALSRELIQRLGGRPDEKEMVQFFRAYQAVTPLTMGELWALPAMLRVAVVENLCACLLRVSDQEEAYDRSAVFAASPLIPDLPDEQVVANSIRALHDLLKEDWKVFFEWVSTVHDILRDDPANVYDQMDFETRDRYRKAVEEIALWSKDGEELVAETAIELARDGGAEGHGQAGASGPEGHVGYYLLDAGRVTLEAKLACTLTFGERVKRWIKGHPTLAYLGTIAACTLLVVLAFVAYGRASGGQPAQLVGIALLALVPAIAAVVDWINYAVIQLLPPQVLPKLDFREGVPADCRTAVVIPALLTSEKETDFLLQQLELHFLGNEDENLYFALLTDYADAPEQHMPEDETLLARAKSGIASLNQKYGREGADPFFFFHRERRWNEGESRWMGWERKRGKLAEFNQLITDGADTSFVVQMGAVEALSDVKYVITLDADTSLPRDAAQSLVGTIAHPLNRARFDPDTGELLGGYTVLQPRTEIKPASANASLFAEVYSGGASLDLYSRAVSDVYQDLFGEGIYVGKGIYDVVAFERSLEGRIPENALLSHDLFEGIHGRAALVTDVILYEEYPPHYPAYAKRMHRWVRGDWQLIPWLLPRVPHAEDGRARNPLSVADRWKLLDNLRRSVVAPALLALFVAGWVWLPGPAWVWTLAAVLATAMPLLTSVLGALAQPAVEDPHVERPSLNLADDALRWLLGLGFIPYETLLVADAILSTLVRVLITHRHMLQWTTAAHTVRLFGRQTELATTWMRMGGATVLGVLVSLLVAASNWPALLVAGPLLVAWLLSPLVAHWVSQPRAAQEQSISEADRGRLRLLARRTWLFFERFVGPGDHWLAPDHYQEDPQGLVAHRTSPTNIGMLLLSTLGAYDLGYIGLLELTVRLGDTIDAMDALERHRGHLLNWYDTRNMEPLGPKYVSTVDSGNLVACLLALRQACLAASGDRLFRRAAWQGLLDTLGALREALSEPHREEATSAVDALRDCLDGISNHVSASLQAPEGWVALLDDLQEHGWQELNDQMRDLIEANPVGLDEETLAEMRIWRERLGHHLSWMRREVDLLMPWVSLVHDVPPAISERVDGSALGEAWREWIGALADTPSLGEISGLRSRGEDLIGRLREALAEDEGQEAADDLERAREWCADLEDALSEASIGAASLLAACRELADRAERWFEETRFDFLLDRDREVFHIGYNVMAEKADDSYYDLLASEARVASLLAIAKGDVPQSHWLHMARPLTRVDGRRALLSWSGTMFEYLMPLLVVRSPEGSLLEDSCLAAIQAQIDYGRRNRVPWGISESGYYRFDAGQAYQYQAFGVPGLGLKRGLGEDLVVTPYASLLALGKRPQEVIDNLERLCDTGMRGRYGLYEAIDYTRSRLPKGRKRAIVRSYMAHHQGMILLSLVNTLGDEAMVRRFHADPRVQSAELLLYEQTPRRAPLENVSDEETGKRIKSASQVELESWEVSPKDPLPQVHCLSNGSLSSFITAAGGGYSQRAPDGYGEGESVALTRWQADTTLDKWGTWIYVEDEEIEGCWSVGYQPTAVEPEELQVLFSAHKAEFRRRDHGLTTRMEVVVPPEEAVEVRRIVLTNHTDQERHITLTSYGEVCLAPLAEDRRHLAFSKIFVESEYVEELHALVFRRRPRAPSEKHPYLAHFVLVEGDQEVTGAFECDRERFLGRGHSARSPVVMEKKGRSLTGQAGATLDPVMSLAQRVRLEAHGTCRVAFVTAVAPSRQEALDMVRRQSNWRRVDAAFERARSQAVRDERESELDSAALRRIDALLSALLYPHGALRPEPATLSENRSGQPSLWAFGISGDYPILMIQLHDEDDLDLAAEVLKAHARWREQRVQVDLVLLNMRETGYAQELQGLLRRLLRATNGDYWLNQRGGIFILRADQMNESEQALMATAARVVLDGPDGSLAEQLEKMDKTPVRLPAFAPTMPGARDTAPTPPLERQSDLAFDNGLGGFGPDGREYVINLEPGEWTPAPWINVIANPEFGFLVSETGAGYTWCGNSGENRLTPWQNDPVSDPPGEALYLRDEETGQVWSPTPLPARVCAPYTIRHGAGYSIFEHNSHGLKQRLRLFAASEEPVKVVHLRLENTWDRNRRITATFYAEWVLGTSRETAQQYVIPEFDPASQALLARNPYNLEFGERVAFLASSQAPHGLTADRTEFLGRMGDQDLPAALERIGLSGTVEAGLDPCAAMQIHLELASGEVKEAYFLLGQGADRDQAVHLVTRYQDPSRVQAAWQDAVRGWDELLGTVQVRTPDAGLDLMLNRWLLYQALACRVWGRSAFYQSSGAYGFRDQLQDVMALTHAAPALVREHLLRAARHQFEEGDVLHWWHPPSGRGVRTRISDDLLWLPFVTAHYVAATGDEGVLDEREPFLQGDPLGPEEEERYGHYQRSSGSFSLYEHCKRALARGVTEGAHGLPLIGTGDWNDGMNRVGAEGRGESVWLGWFAYANLVSFAPICARMGDEELAAAYRQRADRLREALEEHAWDGSWYRRAYYDDGTPLGSEQSKECEIDSIAQSWAALSGAGDGDRVPQAMRSVEERLVRTEDQLILLFTPPFDKTPREPGYIKGYPPGIRENGGQYTHAALWAVWAFAKLGRGELAGSLFRLLNPVYHSDQPDKVARYQVEPYVVAADVYSVDPHTGRGGWTWYTGSSGWMYRLGLEAILGLERKDGALQIDPRIPKDWPGFEIAYRHGGARYNIAVQNPDGRSSGVKRVTVDGEETADKRIPLRDDGQEHEVEVVMG